MYAQPSFGVLTGRPTYRMATCRLNPSDESYHPTLFFCAAREWPRSSLYMMSTTTTRTSYG